MCLICFTKYLFCQFTVRGVYEIVWTTQQEQVEWTQCDKMEIKILEPDDKNKSCWPEIHQPWGEDDDKTVLDSCALFMCHLK